MSMLAPVIKMFLKAEIDTQINKYISILTGELDNKNLKLHLHVKISEIELTFTGTGKLLGDKTENLKTEHVKSYSFDKNTGDGDRRSALNNPDKASLELNVSGKNILSGIKFRKEFMGMGVKIESASFHFDITGKAEY